MDNYANFCVNILLTSLSMTFINILIIAIWKSWFRIHFQLNFVFIGMAIMEYNIIIIILYLSPKSIQKLSYYTNYIPIDRFLSRRMLI